MICIKSASFFKNIVLFQGNLVLLYDHKSKAPFSENELTNLKNLCVNFGVKAGVSNSFDAVYRFETYYRQAMTALNLGEEIGSPESVMYYDELCVLHMVKLFSEHSDPRDIIHPAIFQLQKHDLECNSDLCDTLMEYLRNNRDMALTSDKLHIHYNTLKYRIRKLTDLTGLDLSENNLLFRLWLSFLTVDYLKKVGRLFTE